MKSLFFRRNFTVKAGQPVKTLGFGANTIKVSAMGLGCMGMTESYYGATSRNECITTIRRAYYESNITFFDTADIYGNGDNEVLLGEAIKNFRKEIVLASKFGLITNPHNPKERLMKANYHYVFSACEASLKRLNTDYIDIYYLHRLDPQVPIEETMTALAELVKLGKIRHIGLSEVNVETIRRAIAVHPVTAVQTEYSLLSRQPAEAILPVCNELGISFVAYSPLGRGMLTRQITDINKLDIVDKRRILPRFQAENLQHNLQLVDKLDEIAKRKKIEVSQLALTWLLNKSDKVIPIFGAKKYSNVEKCMQAISIELTQDEMTLIDSIATLEAVKGDRYGKDAMMRLKY